MIAAPAYWRHNKTWSQYIGKEGTVVAETYIRVTETKRELFAPYSYVVVDIDGERIELMAEGHARLKVGDTVQCVLRKAVIPESDQIIEYCVKAKKVYL